MRGAEKRKAERKGTKDKLQKFAGLFLQRETGIEIKSRDDFQSDKPNC